MPANISLRLCFKNSFIVVKTKDDSYQIEITDTLGHNVANGDREAALEFLLTSVSRLRQQAYRMLGRKPR